MRAQNHNACAATGDPIWGESLGGAVCRQRRASFFRPSPTANLVGVEEGNLCQGALFLLQSGPGRLVKREGNSKLEEAEA